jgi:beta-aspartyl-peptidase (threonine type)
MKNAPAIAIHGGAGTIDRSEMTPEKELAYNQTLLAALDAGKTLLLNGAAAEFACEAAVKVLEDSPLFNAGRGAVFTSDETIELDASVMRGIDLEAGAISGVTGIKNPVSLAMAVMQHSAHVMLSGKGAETFARLHHQTFAPTEYFYTDLRWHQLQSVKGTDISMLDHGNKKPIGTVGAVALDIQGNLAAATSTGGMTNKKFGRIGDTPIIGAGTYADNRTCAVSCTGHGEFFIRTSAAFQVHMYMLLSGAMLREAANKVIHDVLAPMEGEGGLIAIDRNGQICMPFNSAGMYRGSWSAKGNSFTEIYGVGKM